MLKFEYIQIEPTFNCNLLCRHCGRGRKYVGAEMSIEELNIVLDQFKSYEVNHIAFNGGGETFTHKNIEEMFAVIVAKGYHISTITNGTLLHKKNMEFIIKNGLLFHMILSMEGVTKKTFESNRGKDTFAIFTNNIKKIQSLKKKWNTIYPIITLNIVCMKNNLKELPLIADFAKSNGIREIIYVHLNPIVKANHSEIENKLCVPEQHLSKCDPLEVKNIFEVVKEKTCNGDFDLIKIPNIKFNNSDFKTKSISKKSQCNWVQKRTFINWEGFVLPCCQVGRHDIHFGNIFQKSFDDIWSSEEYTEFRDRFHKGDPHPICQNCNEYKGIGFG